jgi:hypothetical protein
MKRLAFTILAVAVLALPVCAQRPTGVADIPFSFVAGNATMPAGRYEANILPESIAVRLVGRDRHTHLLASTTGNARSDQPELVFHQYGDQYFLSEIRTPIRSREFPVSPMEREAQKSASAGHASQEIVLAMR